MTCSDYTSTELCDTLVLVTLIMCVMAMLIILHFVVRTCADGVRAWWFEGRAREQRLIELTDESV